MTSMTFALLVVTLVKRTSWKVRTDVVSGPDRADLCLCLGADLTKLQPVYTSMQIQINSNWFDFTPSVNANRIELH